MTDPFERGRSERVQRYRRGAFAEYLAAAHLMLKGYRILGRRVRLPLGELDLIAVRGRRLAFIEVKARQSQALAEAAIGDAQERRIAAAADLWLARRPRYRDYEIGFDVVFVLPGRWPQHVENGLVTFR